MNIVVLGAGFRNKGNEAMLRVVQRELSLRIKGANIFALLPLEEDSALAYASGVTPVSRENLKIHRYFGNRMADRISVIQYLLKMKNLNHLGKSIFSFQDVSDQVLPRMIDEIIGGIDAVVDIHGYAFGDPWPMRSVNIAKAWGDLCMRARKPYIFFPQSWGPFEKKGYAELVASLLQNSPLFYAREELSQEQLAKALKKPIAQIPTAPDMVLRFEGGAISMGEGVLGFNGVKRGEKPLLGISPNMRVYERTSGLASGNEYIRLLTHLCDYLIEHFQVNVVLIPNEINPRGYIRRDDRYLCGLISSMVQDPSRCFPLRDYYSAEQIRSVVACLDLLVGSRFHTLVFALSAGVPLVGLGWAHKYDGLLRQFGLQEFFCHFSQFSEQAILDLVRRAWDEKEATALRIRTALPHLQADVDAVFDKVAHLCLERQG